MENEQHLMTALHMAQACNELLRANCTAIHWAVMNAVRDAGMEVTKLATTCHTSIQNMSGIVERVEKLGYIQRAHSTEDRRKVLVTLTPKGRERLNSIAA